LTPAKNTIKDKQKQGLPFFILKTTKFALTMSRPKAILREAQQRNNKTCYVRKIKEKKESKNTRLSKKNEYKRRQKSIIKAPQQRQKKTYRTFKGSGSLKHPL
jgi:hypothetical protein